MNDKSNALSQTNAATLDAAWSPQTTPLSTEQIDDIINRIQSKAKYAKIEINSSVLHEDLNDLLDATGLFRVTDEDQWFHETDGPKDTTSKNAHHTYISGVFDDLAKISNDILELLTSDGVGEYLAEVMPKNEIIIPPTATIGLTRHILDQAKSQLGDLAGPELSDTLGLNDPFLPKAHSILDALDQVIDKVQRHDLSPKLNAKLRAELHKSRTLTTATSLDASTTVTVDYFTMVAHLRALLTSATSLSAFERSQVPRNRERDTTLDSLLHSLAHIFLSTVGSNTSPIKLTKPFTDFAMDVLQPFYPADSLNPSAIQKRWQRLKKEGQEATSKT